MRRTANKPKRSPLRFFTILVTIITVFMLLRAFGEITRASRGYYYDYRESDYAYSVMDGDYGALYDTTIRNARESTYKGDIPAYRNLAFYYEQAVLAHAYEENGDAKKAEAFRARMKEYEAQLGSLSGEAAKVRTKIGMEP